MRRYPLAPLLDATGLSLSALAQRVGIGGGEYARVRTEGVSELAADRWANRLGLHPAEVWPDFGYEECADPRCTQPFAPKRTNQRYCTEACGNRHRARERARRKYRADEAWREAKKAEVAAYRAENARALRVKAARWREANRQERNAQQRAYYEANRDRILARQREYDRRKREAA